MSDFFLGGRVAVRQLESGFRSGLDAVMRAAAVPAYVRTALELGAGVGAASLCLAARVKTMSITGLEIDAGLAALACENAKSNRMARRVRFVAGDVHDLPRSLRGSFDQVFCNPPFHSGARSPDAARARALLDEGRLGGWLTAGLKRTASGGTFTCIVSAERMAEALAVLPQRGTRAFPLWPKAGAPAGRVILQTRKGSRAAFVLLSGLVLHDANGRYTAAAEAVLRDGGSLALDSAPL